MNKKSLSSENYAAWLGEVKSRIQAARIVAARSVNRELILLYWDIGRGILEKQEELGWGRSVVGAVGERFEEGFSRHERFIGAQLVGDAPSA